MKVITINVSEPIYRAFQVYARANDRTASELIREAMAQYHDTRLARRSSILDFGPLSLGEVHAPLGADDDLLAEMLDD